MQIHDSQKNEIASRASANHRLKGGISATPPGTMTDVHNPAHEMFSSQQQPSRNAFSHTMQGGLPSGEEQGFVGGATIGETIGDAVRPVSTAVGNVVGDIAGAVTGVSISSSTNTGPNWNDHGSFEWVVGFGTTGASGYIVQKITNTYRAEDSAGAAIGGTAPTPTYWEAWAVDASGNISPGHGPNNDYWLRPSKGAGSQGHWSMEGDVYFTTTNPATVGFTPGGVPDAGILLSTTTDPGGLGIARLHRYAQGTWDSTGATPVHTGSAT